MPEIIEKSSSRRASSDAPATSLHRTSTLAPAVIGSVAHRVLALTGEALQPMQPVFLALSLFSADGVPRPVALHAATRRIHHALAEFRWHEHPSVRAAEQGSPHWCGWPMIRTELPALCQPPVDAGAWAAVPLCLGDEPIGTLAACFHDGLVFDEPQRSLIVGVARITALALRDGLESALSEHAVEEALQRERARLAADLHDGVVQQVIATSMALAEMTSRGGRQLGEQLGQLIDRQDDIVRQLRATIYSLRNTTEWNSSATVEVVQLIDRATPTLGFTPELHVTGDLGHIDAPTQLGHVLYALNEALSNVARHAAASRVVISLTVDDTRVAFEVADNGRGLDHQHAEGNGLTNLDRRARMLGGSCHVHPSPLGGTSVQWSIPVGG